ncbi:NRPS [Trichoderma virens FT-333]|nr:NRPS [Trichoderma virens FT-333]
MLANVFSEASHANGHLPPFSLLGTAKAEILQEIESQYGFRGELIEDVYPCTPIQKGLLSLTTKQAGDYVMHATFELASGVSLDTFCAAWDEVVSRMPILRTRIVHHSTLGLLQVVMKEKIRWIRTGQLQTTGPEDETIGQVFGQDLSRYTIIELDNEKTLFDWRIHHALYDGWSLAQISSMVNQACHGSQLSEPRGFSSFVQYVLAQNCDDSQQYWQSILQGNDFVQFPTAPPPTSEPTRALKTEHLFRRPQTRPPGITNSTLISAAWALVAAGHTGSNDVVFGMTVSGRDAQLHGIKDIAGPTIATVPVRVRFGKTQPIYTLLEAIQRGAAERKPYEQMGIQAIAAINEDTQRACAFQTAIVVQPVENDLCTDPLVGSWQTSSKEQVVGTYALMLQCYLLDEDIRLEAIFNPQSIDTSLVSRLLERMGLVMGQLAESTTTSGKTVAEIETMTAAEQQQIYSWNSQVPAAEEQCIHKLVQGQALQSPDSPAVCSWDGTLTYRQLDEFSTGLAHHLITNFKVQPGVFVPMCFEKSMWTVVAMLGILKAGGAFVPLDPTQAVRRRDGLLNQIDAHVVLASENYAETAFGQGRTVVAVGNHNTSLWGNATAAAASIRVPPNPTSAAYLIFTSGSTGEPKGVVIEHRSVSTSCRYNGTAMGFTTTSRVYQFAAYTFDVSIQETLTTLIYGGCVCIPSDEDRLRDIGQSMNSMKVTLTLLTPSTARLIQPSAVPTLRTIVLGGEKLADADIRQWAPDKQVYVTYGPSECAISCTTGQLDNVNLAEKRGYIGTPLGCVTWIVDSEDHNKLAPMGAVGELLIEGPIVGRGYLNDDRKTAAVFLEHTRWLEQAGRSGRLYKTGDLVRYSEDGSLIFVGRKDSQVKIRGQRVELGEVEHHLRECMQDAREVIVEVIKPTGKDSKPMLAAFLCLDTDQIQDGGSIRVIEMEYQLADRLPSYMIPSVCFALAEMPKTISGKTDRKQLIEMGQSFSAQQLADMNSNSNAKKRQPTTELEFKLQELWARVLNISPASVGLDDSFFRLGGDSISAMSVSSAARSLQLNISTSDVLRKKTIGRLLSDKSTLTMTQSPSVTADEQPGRPFSLSPIQELYLHLQPDPAVCFDQCFLLRVSRRITPAAVEKACSAVIDHHPMLRARFRPGQGGRLEQFISIDNTAPYEFSHFRNLSPSDMANAIAQGREKLDIKRGPLFVAALFDDANGQSLFLGIHHLIVDLMSWRILLQDLEELLTVGSIAALPAVTFQTWCTLQAEFAAKQSASEYALPFELRSPMLDYWGIDAARNLWGGTTSQGFRLERDVTAKLMGSCNDAFQTRPVELFVSAMIRSFGLAFTDRSLPPVFCEGHGREPWDSSIDLSRTIGWFTTAFPVQLADGAEKDLRETVRQTKDCIRSFNSNGWLYFASRFIEENSAEEFMSLFPVEIAFNYVGAYQQLEREDALFEILSLPDGSSPESASLTRRISLFEVSVTVEKGYLDVTFTYPKDIQHQASVTTWLRQYEATLTQMADLLPGRATEWTLEDFPLAFKNYSDLDRFRENFLPQLDALQAIDVEDVFPCSPMQEGMLISQAKSAENYRVALLLEVVPTRPEVKVDLDRLRDAWIRVVQRHGLLRALIVDTLPGTSQFTHILLKNPEPSITFLPNSDGASSVEAFRQRYGLNTYQGGDLQHHVTLCQGPNDTSAYFYLEMNHAISDGYTQNILLSDLQKAYSGSIDSAAPLYKDYISHLAKQPYEEGRRYWSEYLTGVEPCYFPQLRDGSQKEEAGHSVIRVPDLDAKNILAFCAEWEVTVATVVQAAWALILSRYSGSTMTCFGNLSSGRDLPIDGVDNIVGPLIGMLTCRVDLATSRTVLELLRDVQEDTWKSLPFQSFPLSAVHSELKLGAIALFNSGVSFQNHGGKDEADASEIQFEYIDQLDPTEYDIHINAVASDTGLAVAVSYSHHIMTATQAARVAESLSVAMSALTTQPHGSVHDLEIIGPSDIERLWDWNRNVPAGIERCVYELIDDRTAQHPEAPAICAWDGSATYAELDQLSTNLAAHLQSKGIGKEMFVPMCFEKSMWAVVAILGVLKSGGAFVPLDPSQAPSRREGLLAQTNASLILTSPKYADLPFGANREVISVGPESASAWAKTSAASLTPPTPTNAAYMIFTSGSTGEPKGVLIEHQSVGTSCWAHGGRVGFNASSRVLQFAAYTFDASLMDVLTTLIYGGCICIPSEEDRLVNMAQCIDTMQINLAFLTPSIARHIEPSSVPTLRTLILGGERVANSDYTMWSDEQRTLLNGYGPTECSIGCMVNTMDSNTVDQGCIGKAVGSVSWIVDAGDHNKLVPIGVVGELLIEGPIVGRGYHCRPEKTNEVFIQDPYWLTRGVPEIPDRSATPGRHARLYKTGDLARYNEDGSVSFIGRKDNQVKIRGQRAELGEIEYQVQQCLDAHQIAVEVILPASDASSAMLAAFVCIEDAKSDAVDTAGAWAQVDDTVGVWIVTVPPEAEEQLARHLPSYMVPTVYFKLMVMPMTVSGKIDRNRLRQIGASFSVQRLAELRGIALGTKRQPTTDVEIRLQQLWSQVLNVSAEVIGLDDNFFLLGGQSISALKLITAARLTGLQFSVADVFQHPKLHSLAKVLSEVARSNDIEEVPAFSLLGSSPDVPTWRADIAKSLNLETAMIEDMYPCTALQEGLMALSARNLGDYVLQQILDLSDVDMDAFKDAWEQTVQSNPILRTRIVQHSKLGLLQVVVKESIRWVQASNVDKYLQDDLSLPMGLGQPLVRYAFINDGSSSQGQFVFTIHHSLYDGWSLPRVLASVNQAYNGKTLPRNPGFNIFVKYLMEHGEDDTEAYWQSMFASCEPQAFPTLPTSIQEPKADSTADHQCALRLPAHSDITLSNLVRAAWAIVHQQRTGSTDVVFGAILSGRNAPVVDIENIIGPTIATVPVVVHVQPTQCVSAFLREVQDASIEMIPYQHIGLQRIAKIDAGTQRGCNFQTLLVVQPPDEGLADIDSLGEWRLASGADNFSSYALTLTCGSDNNGVKLNANFDSRVVEPWLMKKMLEELDFVMQQLVREGASYQTLGNIDTLTPSEREEIWSRNTSVPGVERCIHDLIGEQVRKRPQEPAITAWDGQVSYEELDELSTRLAHHLIKLGVTHESFVPLFFEKSMWTIVAMLGVFKAGGSFVPFDPAHSSRRRQNLLLNQTNATIVLMSAKYSGSIPVGTGRKVVTVSGSDAAAWEPVSRAVPIIMPTPSSAAYMLFTSGSTGEPKGVVIEHRSLSSSCWYHGARVRFDTSSRVLQFAAYTFDACIMEIITTLIYGGCICVPSDKDRLENLPESMSAMGVNLTFLTPSVARLIKPASVPSLQTLILGGERVTEDDVKRWEHRQPPVQLYNGYGPTETTVFAVMDELSSQRPVVIGKSVGSVSWIVDANDHNKLLPIGAVGELVVEGPIVGRGYLHDAVKTAAAYIEDPVWLLCGASTGGIPGRHGRVYKTGDLVRYTEQGSLSYLGRKDNQVKIRGQRIELGEVEHGLAECIPDARHIVAEIIVPERDGSSPMLVAFICIEKEGSDIEAMAISADMETQLRYRLPGYMMPSTYFTLTEMPTTTSGKIDRKRLREMGASLSARQLLETSNSGEKRQPTTDVEHQLQRLWARVLNLTETIGLDDSFFLLGGDSIGVIKLIAEASEDHLLLSVADIFRYPTLAQMAQIAVPQDKNGQSLDYAPKFSLIEDVVDVSLCCDDIADTLKVDASQIEDVYPCTALQEGLVALTTKQPGAYVWQKVLRMSLEVNLDTFRQAWEQTVQAMPVLRTRIVQHERIGLLQVVLKDGIQWIQADDLDGYLKQDRSQLMGLDQPLARYALIFDASTQQRWFVWTIHHALYDGWSLPQILKTAEDAYQGIQIVQRPSFSLFVKDVVAMKRRDGARKYWESLFAGCNPETFPPLPLQTSILHEPRADSAVDLDCPVPSTPGNITLSTLIRAAWALVLHHHTSSDDVVFGVTLTGRNAPVAGIENIVGPTIATVPVVIRTHLKQSVAAYLDQTQGVAVDMIPYEQTGLQQIAKFNAETMQCCKFQNLLVIQPVDDNLSTNDSVFGEWGGSAAAAESFSSYGLVLEVELGANKINAAATFDSRMIQPWLVRKLLERLASLMHQLAEAQPEQTLAELNMVTPQDLKQVWDWNKTVPEPVERCIHDMVDEYIESQPDAIAVNSWDGDLTYAELGDLSSRLAQRLMGLGVGADDDAIVPLCFEKSRWAVVAMLAVLKAGAAFVMLEPSLPEARLLSIVEQTGSKLVVSSIEQAATHPDLAETTVCIGPGYLGSLPESSVVPIVQQNPSSTMYVIFTSGSTGKAKGVLVTHRAFCSATVYQAGRIGFIKSMRSYEFASYSFDASIEVIFFSLATGGCLVVPSDWDRKNNLTGSLVASKAELVDITPSIVRTLDRDLLVDLKVVIMGGEPAKKEDVTGWHDGMYAVVTYGPSECTPQSMVKRSFTMEDEATNIGYAAGSVTWVVDATDSNRLVPVGAIGELLLEGPIVGKGYLHDPEKTAAVFIQDPSWLLDGAPGHPGRHARIYKTGDLVRYNADGSMNYIGRKDNQVKIRGQRVELGEVENHILACVNGVREVAAEVILPAGDGASPTLVAFLLMQEDFILEETANSNSYEDGDLRARVLRISATADGYLTERLPKYMDPAIYFTLKEMPVNSSGKTDRRQLRAIGANFSTRELAEKLSGSSRNKRKPSTARELVLQEIWARILNIDAATIGADDSFFHLGGDSIGTMRLVAAARRVDIALSVAEVFRNPQLSALACLSSGVAAKAPEKLEPFSLLGEDDNEEYRNRIAAACDLSPELIDDAYPCTPLQEGLLSLTAKSAGAYTTRSVLTLSENVDMDLFRHAWEQVAQRLPILRTRIIQDVELGLVQAVIHEDIQWRSGNNLDKFIQEDAAKPMGLGHSLCRYAIIVEEEGSSKQRRCLFVWTIHHVLYDGQFFGQIPQLAYQIYKGLPQPSFKDFKYFSRYIKNMNMKAVDTYWRSEFNGYEFTPFPASLLTSEPVTASSVVRRQLHLPPRAESDITAASLVRAAWALTMGACSNSADVVFGVTVTGRQSDLADVEDIAGPTFATVPVRVQLHKTQTVTAYLRQVQDQSIKMIPYEQAGLQRIKKVSQEARLACQFQTLLVIQPAQEEDAYALDKELGTWAGDMDIQNFASYALNLICTMNADGVMVDAIFDPAVVSKWVVEAMTERLGCVIQQLASATADSTLANIDTLSAADYEQIWSRNAKATMQPKEMAVCAWDGNLTYAKLYEKSTRLAHVLVGLGVGKQQPLVPMLFEKSRWTIVAMLAVMMAGGAIVPIDPSQPADRRERLVSQTGAKLIVTSAQFAKMMTRPSRVVVAVSEKNVAILPEPPRSAVLAPVEAQMTAYIMFTSGNNGQPKGVVVDHQANTTSCVSNAQSMKISTHTRLLQYSPYSLDVSMLEIFATLAHGGCVCVPSEDQRLNQLESFINDNNVNFSILTPTVSQLLEPSRVPSLSTVILSGETCEDQVFGRWMHCTLVCNAYRHTESTMCSLHKFGMAMSGGFSLGTAVGAVFWVTVTGDVNRLAPPGAVGELVIEGPVLAQGYLNNPDKTATSFIQDPAWLLRGAPGHKGRRGRLYKTGDLVRYSEDGSLVYLGRHDSRVTIRGQRVDLAEVEYHVKASIPGVQRAIAKVMMPSGDEASSMLAAFLLMEQSPDRPKGVQVMTVSAALDDELAERLPAHMIPAIYFTMDELPMNSSGMVDLSSSGDSLSTQQLTEMLSSSRPSKRIPATVKELALQQVWARILNIDVASIGADDGFFQRGGDSISAMRLVSEARRIGIAISVADIFRNPRLSALASLSPRMEEELPDEIEEFSLLGEDVALSRSRIAAACHLEPSLIQDAYPCTSLQEGLLSLTTQSSGAYVERIVVALPEHVDLDMFRYAWEQAVRTLSILRTRIIHDEQFGLVQVIIREDIQWASGDALSTFLEQDAVELMGLGQPLSRYAIVQDQTQQSQRAWFVWTIHHALYDGQFLARVPQLISKIYKGLPQPAFKDFKYFARYLKSIDTEVLDDYWRSEFKGYDSTPFPTPSGTIMAANSTAERQLQLPPVADPTITVANLIRAAWALVIAADSGTNDVVFGATVTGRKADVAGIEDLAGPTIATVPVRIQTVAAQGVTAYLRQVQEQSIQMIPYEQAGLQRIREISEEANRACQFQSLLVIQPSQEADITELAGDDLGQWTSDSEATSFSTYALNLTCSLTNDGAKFEAIFDSTAISEWNVEAMLERLSHIIQQLASISEGQPLTVADIDLLSATDRKQLSLWNSTVPAAVEKCVHNLIEEQALACPQATAICAWDGDLTYSELDTQATRLAHHLVDLGVGPEVMVALCFDKSKWAVVAMIAVLKAGGAFVPLDMTQASSRREAVFAQIGAQVVLTSNTYVAMLATPGRAVISVDDESIQNLPATSRTQRASHQQPSSAAYVFFTSGSTGQPKGVMVDHRAVSTSCVSHGREIGFNKQTRMLQFTSYTFDVSIMEVLTTLIYGGCICVPSNEERFNDLEGSIGRMKANVASLTPSVARLVDPSRTPSVKTIVLAGENASDQDLNRWSHISRINAYGPTESTIFCSINKISASNDRGGSCIGKAVGSVSWVVLPSDASRLAPVGAIGELLVEGPILARGYFNDPEKTAAAFIENPPWLLHGGRNGRLYKTGDLVRYNPDGSLTYQGRKDNQVKIRGQRVDLGEVEYHVQACVPGIRQVVAEIVVPGGDRATPILAAFVVLDKKLMSNEAQVIHVSREAEDKLSERLPAYMVPKVFFAIGEISINGSGKTDRGVLRRIGAEFSTQRLAELQSSSLANKRAPSSETEKALQQIWARVLNIDPATIGADESFFRLGGDSISAMMVSAAARSSQVDVSTADVLRKKTISRLAASALVPKRSSGPDPTDNHDDDGQPFQMGPIQQFHTQLEPNPTKCFDQNFLLKLRKAFPFVSVAQAIETIVSRHPMLRARFSQTSEGAWQQRITNDISGSFHISKASNAAISGPEEAECIRQCRELLDIESGPLLAAVLYEDDAESQKLFVTVHHLVIDLVSWRVLLMELEELLIVGKLDSPVTTSFRTWCDLQGQFAAEHLDSQLEAIQVPPPLLSYWGIQSDENVIGATTVKSFVLDDATSAAILGDDCNQVFNTRPMELMASALVHSFRSVFEDREAPAIFSEGHGRETWDDDMDIDVTRTIGWFTTIFPVYVPMAQGGAVADTIRQTKDFVRKLSKNGWSYFTSRFADQNKAKANTAGFPAEILLNFAGSYQQLERGASLFEPLPLPEGCDPASFSGVRRYALFDVFAATDKGRLAISVVYPKNARHQSKINMWVEQYQSLLQSMASLLPQQSQQWTLADYPMAFSSYDDLAEFETSLLPELSITMADIEDIYPCTPVQERILATQAKNPETYRVVLEFEVLATGGSDRIDLSRIEQTWRSIVQRHSLLRAHLVTSMPGSSSTMHVVLKDPVPSISHIPFSNGNGDDSKQKTCHASVGYGKHGLQHNLSISQLDGARAHLRIEMNHAIIDGHSVNVLIRDFRQAYRGSASPPAPLHSEFIKYIQQQSGQADPKFWPTYLDGVSSCLMPTSGSSQRENGTYLVDVAGIDADKIHNFCMKWEVTTATVIQVAWALVLQRYTGSKVPCLGMLTSGRDVPVDEVNDMFGALISLVPCRIHLDKPRTVLKVLKDVQEDYADCLPHQTYALAEFTKAVPRAEVAELFNTAISFQRAGGESVTFEDEGAIIYRGGQDPVEHDIYIRVLDGPKTLRIVLELWEDRISRTQGEEVAAFFAVAISAIIFAPEEDILSLTL